MMTVEPRAQDLRLDWSDLALVCAGVGILNLGKRLLEPVYLSDERCFTDLQQQVRRTYRLSRRWNLKAQTGRENTPDLLCSIEFV